MATSNMKISVMYRGIVYRVRGIKVLCSVVTAVILLLVTLVALGVWMLISAYASPRGGEMSNSSVGELGNHFGPKSHYRDKGSRQRTVPTEIHEETTTVEIVAPTVQSIETGVHPVLPTREPVPSHEIVAPTEREDTGVDNLVNEAIGHFQGVTPPSTGKATADQRISDPTFGMLANLFNLTSPVTSGYSVTPTGTPDIIFENWSPNKSIDDSRQDVADIYKMEPGPELSSTEEKMDHRLHSNENQPLVNGVSNFESSDTQIPIESPDIPGIPAHLIPKNINPALLRNIPASLMPDNISTANLHKFPAHLLPKDFDPMMLGIGLPFPLGMLTPTNLEQGRPNRRRGDQNGNFRRGPSNRYRPVPLPIRSHSPLTGQAEKVPILETRQTSHEMIPRIKPLTKGTSSVAEHHSDASLLQSGVELSTGINPAIHSPETTFIPSTIKIDLQFPETNPINSDETELVSDHPIENQNQIQFSNTPGLFMPGNLANLDRRPGNRPVPLIPINPGEFRQELNAPGKRPSFGLHSNNQPNQFKHKSGMPVIDGEDFANQHLYNGPPVVGYGNNLYRGRPPETSNIPFEQFPVNINPNETLTEKFNEQQLSDFRINQKLPTRNSGNNYRMPSRPFMRGPRPNGQGYGPIASRPSEMNDHTAADLVSNANRQEDLSLEKESIFFGPLNNLIDYSKKLVSTIFSFPNDEGELRKQSDNDYVQNSIELMENYNNIFTNSSSSHAMQDKTPSHDTFLNTDHLRSMNPLDLSLLAWTFLDFWEFVIEKVGTLSKEDLQQLETRLDKFRQEKDTMMAQSIINATLLQASQETTNATSFDMRQVLAIAEQLLRAPSQSPKISDFSPVSGRSAHTKPKIDWQLSSEKDSQNNLTLHLVSDVNVSNQTADMEARTGDQTAKVLLKETFYDERVSEVVNDTSHRQFAEFAEGRMFDPLGLFSNELRVQFMGFAAKVLLKFSKVYLQKSYALDCMMLLFCKDINAHARKDGTDGLTAKVKSVGLKVLTMKKGRDHELDTINEVWRAVTAWETLKCDNMFPQCDGARALEIVNAVSLGSRK